MDVLSSPSNSGTPVSEWFRCCLPKSRDNSSSLKKPCENIILQQPKLTITQPNRRENVNDFTVTESSLSNNSSSSSSSSGFGNGNTSGELNTPKAADKAVDDNEDDSGSSSEPNTPTAVDMDDDDEKGNGCFHETALLLQGPSSTSSSDPNVLYQPSKDSSLLLQKQQPTTTLTKSLVHNTELVWHVIVAVLSFHWLTQFLTGKHVPPPSSSSSRKEPQQTESTRTTTTDENTPTNDLPTSHPSCERRLTDEGF